MTEGDKMPDWKTILLLAVLTGGTNTLQYFGITVPTETAKSEVTANSDFMRDQLNQCFMDLKECYAQCAMHSGGWNEPNVNAGPGHLLGEGWQFSAPYPGQFEK
jgi:hypothetical protein